MTQLRIVLRSRSVNNGVLSSAGVVESEVEGGSEGGEEGAGAGAGGAPLEAQLTECEAVTSLVLRRESVVAV